MGAFPLAVFFLVVCKHPALWHEKPGKFTMLHHVAPMIMDRPMTLWTVPSLLGAPDLAPRGVYPPFFPAKKIVENWLVVYLPLWKICSSVGMMTFPIPSGNLTELWKITIFNGKTHYKWPFSIAMLNYQRIYGKLKTCSKPPTRKITIMPNPSHSVALVTK